MIVNDNNNPEEIRRFPLREVNGTRTGRILEKLTVESREKTGHQKQLTHTHKPKDQRRT